MPRFFSIFNRQTGQLKRPNSPQITLPFHRPIKGLLSKGHQTRLGLMFQSANLKRNKHGQKTPRQLPIRVENLPCPDQGVGRPFFFFFNCGGSLFFFSPAVEHRAAIHPLMSPASPGMKKKRRASPYSYALFSPIRPVLAKPWTAFCCILFFSPQHRGRRIGYPPFQTQ